MPAFTVDAHRPLGAFDVLGVSFATELGYTNLLTALDLAGIPLHATDRDEHHPVVVAGGHAAFNPEPIADFVDVAAIGDGEEVVGDITDVVRDWKAAGRPGGRPELLLRLAETQGCYVPSLYAVSYGPDGAIAEVRARPARASRARCRSAPPWTSTRGPTRRHRSCRWPRPCTSARASRSSAAAPGAVASARPA